MNIGESVEVRIHASCVWNDTGIRLVEGETYRFTVPEGDVWKDAHIVRSAEGYPSPWFLVAFVWLRRAPGEKWFKLIGALDRKRGTQFAIGTERTLTAPRGGQLTCFANDVILAYGNNSGSVLMKVTRIA